MTSVDIEKIKVLYASATSAKDKKMYQDILSRLGVTIPIPTIIPIPPNRPSDINKSKVDPKVNTLNKPRPNKPVVQLPDVTLNPKPVLEPQVNPMFQAIGILQGDVVFNENNRAVIKIGDIEYPLLCLPLKKRKVFINLRNEIETTGINNQRVIVYPKITHFPSKDEPYVIAFQLVGVIKNNESNKKLGIESQLKDFEFILRGLWQFIPVCRTPCISVYKNFNQARLEWIQRAPAFVQVKFMQGSHIPLLWKDSSSKPFRFVKDAEVQEKPYFVAVKTRFLPQRNMFTFIEELGEALPKAPKVFKASKELKAEALKTKPTYT